MDEVAEVIDRFTTQQATNATLEEQSHQAETDIRDMGQLKEELEKENTVTKYLGQDDDASAIEKLAAMSEDIEDNELRAKRALVKIANLEQKKEALHACFLAIALELAGEEQGQLTTEALVQFCVDQVPAPASQRCRWRRCSRGGWRGRTSAPCRTPSTSSGSGGTR